MPNRLFNRIQSNTPCNFFLYGKLFSLVGILAGTVAYRTPGRKDCCELLQKFGFLIISYNLLSYIHV